MADDRLKQARRSLIDRHNQRNQQSPDASSGAGFEDDFGGEESTQMVDINRFSGPSPSPGRPAPAISLEDSTQMIDLSSAAMHQGPGAAYRPAPAPEAPYVPPAIPRASVASPSSYAPAAAPAPRAPTFEPDDGQGGYEGHTQFVNLNEFVTPGAHIAPETGAAGYEGSTQFVDLASMQAQGPSQPPEIANDPVLRQGYAFGPEAIQHGEPTLIFAQNTLGKPVVLKRLWAGDPNEMPMMLRQRVAQLSALKHASLAAMNGLLVAPTGLWVELERPLGSRLTQVLQHHGPQPLERVLQWARATCDVLQFVHSQQMAYANLTPDALWVQENGDVTLEPFDMLRFEDRGSLGVYGAPEMHQPPEMRQLSPATDLYSLAAVILSAVQGLPLDAEQAMRRISDKRLGELMVRALKANPAERPATAQEFLQVLGGAKGGGPDKGLDIKVVGGGAFLILILVTGYLYMDQQATKTQAAAQAMQAQAQGQPALGAAPMAGAAVGIPQAASPGPLTNDPRLSVITSFTINPVEDSDKELTATPEQIEQLRQKARETLTAAQALKDQEALDMRAKAWSHAAQASRLQPKPSEADFALMQEIVGEGDMRLTQLAVADRMTEQVRNNQLSLAFRTNDRLPRITRGAEAFLKRHNAAQVVKLRRVGAPANAPTPTPPAPAPEAP